MKRVITPSELGSDAEQILSAVREHGERFVIEVEGKGSAALVPIHVFEDYERRHLRMAKAIEALHAAVADCDDAEVEAAIEESFAEVRAERRAQAAAEKSRDAAA